ncbi:hypothetical protein HDU93_006161 [Gonapodya sp. JEL0774]|nr:hypothetical protein HDU93_006161 [Gonapodya sp. JEL0774]
MPQISSSSDSRPTLPAGSEPEVDILQRDGEHKRRRCFMDSLFDSAGSDMETSDYGLLGSSKEKKRKTARMTTTFDFPPQNKRDSAKILSVSHPDSDKACTQLLAAKPKVRHLKQSIPAQPIEFLYEPPIELPDPYESCDAATQKTVRKLKEAIFYADKYNDDVHEFRHVILPKRLFQYIPDRLRNRLLNEAEWRAIGIQQSPGWQHYLLHGPEPHIFLFRREKDFQLKYIPVLAIDLPNEQGRMSGHTEEHENGETDICTLPLPSSFHGDRTAIDLTNEMPQRDREKAERTRADSIHVRIADPAANNIHKSKFSDHREQSGYDDDTVDDDQSVAATEETDTGSGSHRSLYRVARPTRRAAQVAGEQITDQYAYGPHGGSRPSRPSLLVLQSAGSKSSHTDQECTTIVESLAGEVSKLNGLDEEKENDESQALKIELDRDGQEFSVRRERRRAAEVASEQIGAVGTEYGPSFAAGSSSPLFLSSVSSGSGSNVGGIVGGIFAVLLVVLGSVAAYFYISRKHPSVIVRMRKRFFTMTFSKQGGSDPNGSLSRSGKPMAVFGESFAGRDAALRDIESANGFKPKDRNLTDGGAAPPWLSKGDSRAPSLFNVIPTPPESPARPGLANWTPGGPGLSMPQFTPMMEESDMELEWGQDSIAGANGKSGAVNGTRPKQTKSKKSKRKSQVGTGESSGYTAEESGVEEGAQRKGSKKDRKKKQDTISTYTVGYNDPNEADRDGYAIPEHDPFDAYDSEYLGSDNGDPRSSRRK